MAFLPALTWTLVLVLSLFILLRSSDLLTDSAETIGLHFGLSEFIVGVSIVAVGTSLPELVSSIFSVIQGAEGMVSGNVVGSNITNLLLIIGVAAMEGKKLVLSRDLVKVDLPFLVASAFFLTVSAWDGAVTSIEAMVLLSGAVAYMYFTASERDEEELVDDEIRDEAEVEELDRKVYGTLALSILLVIVSARYTVESVINLSVIIGVGETVLSLTAVSIGTSLPEIMVAVTAASKGNSDTAIGTVLGSNIFNTFAVMSVPALIGSVSVPSIITGFGLPVMLMATLLYFFITQDKEITKWEGMVLLLFFILYLVQLLYLA